MGKPYVVVVGGINIDICGRSEGPLIARDSNPGTIRLSMGGVGRNIAHNLSLLGMPVRMLTALGDDEYARIARSACREAGIDLSRARRVPGGRTSSYLFIAGPEGDMALAVCDAALAEKVDVPYLQRQLPLLNRAAAVVLDGNLMPEAIEFLGQNCRAPLFADPVSVTKGHRLEPVLPRLHTIKPNLLEALALTGAQTAEEAAGCLLDQGLKRVFVSLGERGLLCAEPGRQLQLPCPPTELKNATGGGDAMMAALVTGFLAGWDLEKTGRFALAVSSLAVESEETINPALSFQAALKRAELKSE